MDLNALKYLLFGLLFFTQIDLKAQNWLDIQDTTSFSAWKSVILDAKQEYAPDSRSVYYQVYEDQDHVGNYIIETSSREVSLFLKQHTNESLKPIPVSVKLLPDASLGTSTQGIINLSVANLRTKPSHSAEMATQATLGTPVDILKETSGYYLIRTPEGYLAWVDSYGITVKTEEEMEDWAQAEKAIFIDDFGHSFAGNDFTDRVSDLVLGNILIVLEKQKKSWKVQHPDGRVGFVHKEQLMDFSDWKSHTRPNADGVISIAKRMLGVPYLWGGTSNKGVDCSGFTKVSYFMNGMVIPRDASQQALVGLPIDIMKDDELNIEQALQKLKKGDLIFFSASKGKRPNPSITHVAIYIDKGEFIHAAGMVRINSFLPDAINFDSQTLTIVGAKRYLDDTNPGFIKTVLSTKGY